MEAWAEVHKMTKDTILRFSKTYVLGFGSYVPVGRRSVSSMAESRDQDGDMITAGLGTTSKAYPEADEDTVTMAWEASVRALKSFGIKASDVGAVYVGSESHPYAVKPTATILGDALGIGDVYLAADTEFACKAGTAAIQMVAGLVETGLVRCGLACGADVAQAHKGDVLEYTAGAGAGSLVLGSKSKKAVAQLLASFSMSSDTPDFWRRQTQAHPQHAGRFTGVPGYFRHVIQATERFLEQLSMKVTNFDHVVLHMPNGKFPNRAAKTLGLNQSQMKAGFIVSEIGNPYSASTLIGLANVLEVAKKGERILVTSYGSGAGSDCFYYIKE